jgi:hypothetical protein
MTQAILKTFLSCPFNNIDKKARSVVPGRWDGKIHVQKLNSAAPKAKAYRYINFSNT